MTDRAKEAQLAEELAAEFGAEAHWYRDEPEAKARYELQATALKAHASRLRAPETGDATMRIQIDDNGWHCCHKPPHVTVADCFRATGIGTLQASAQAAASEPKECGCVPGDCANTSMTLADGIRCRLRSEGPC